MQIKKGIYTRLEIDNYHLKSKQNFLVELK